MMITIRVKKIVGLAVAAVIAWAGGAVGALDADHTVDGVGIKTSNVQLDSTTLNEHRAGAMVFNNTAGARVASFSSVCTDVSGTLFMDRNSSFAAAAGFRGQTGIDPAWGAGNANGLNSTAAIQAAADIFCRYGNVLTTGTSDQKAGVQLAVWAAFHNTPAGSRAAIDNARVCLDAVNLNDQHIGDLLIPELVSPHGAAPQGAMVHVTPVPEPTTMIAGAVLLLPFALSTFRLRNRAVS